MMLNIFPYAYLLSVHPLWWNDSSDPLLIFQLYCFFSVQLRIESLVYILDATPFINMWLTDISQSVACFSFLFTRSSTKQFFFYFDKAPFIIFSFLWEVVLVVNVKTLCPNPRSQRFSPTCFIVLHFTFKFMINSELIFV